MARAPYPPGDPRRSRVKKGLKKISELAEKYEKEGMSKEEARERATTELRDNPRSDWRGG